MIVTLDPERLRYEMAIRNLDGVSLARAAGVSENTISHALQGNGVRKGTLRQIAAGLLTFPPLRMVEDLVAKPEEAIMLTGTRQEQRPRSGVPRSPAGRA
jgi:transcriptional regulator with XRE-family HTH domain